MKERYGEPFGLNEKEVKDLYGILRVADNFLNNYADFLVREKSDEGLQKDVLLLRIGILSFQRRIIEWQELNKTYKDTVKCEIGPIRDKPGNQRRNKI